VTIRRKLEATVFGLGIIWNVGAGQVGPFAERSREKLSRPPLSTRRRP
jgi:hypothetical protein